MKYIDDLYRYKKMSAKNIKQTEKKQLRRKKTFDKKISMLNPFQTLFLLFVQQL